MAYNTKKYLDEEGLKQVIRLLDEYPDNQILGTVIDEIQSELDKKADVVNIPEVPVQDVQVNGVSVLQDGVANVPPMAIDTYGVAKIGYSSQSGLELASTGILKVSKASDNAIKEGTGTVSPIVPYNQHTSTFYGLAKAAGDTTQSQSSNIVGTYTPEAKGAIQKMLGVSNLIATEENNLIASKAYAIGDVFTANGKLYKATAAIAVDGAIITDGANANCEETNVGEGFVKFTDYASENNYGIIKVGNGLYTDNQGAVFPNFIGDANLKKGTVSAGIISSAKQHISVFYGLAKAAGADEKDSTLSVGQYTDNAKTAIRSMIGAVGDVQVDGTSVVSNGIANLPIMTDDTYGVAKRGNGLYLTNGVLNVNFGNAATVKAGTAATAIASIARGGEVVFYGLAKAAGDTTQSASDNAVGVYTNEAKSAIRTMLGAVGSEDYATTDTAGVVKVNSTYGININSNIGLISINPSTTNLIKQGRETYRPITAVLAADTAFYGLAKAAGDTSQSASSNAVGTYTDNAKASIKAMLGIQDGSTGTVDVSGTTPTITAVENTRYVCGEVTSLNFTPPASGISIVRFTSGSTVTVLTIPSTVKFPEWFDPTSLETNTIYELCVTDGEFGAVMLWAL